jgi:protein KRI1
MASDKELNEYMSIKRLAPYKNNSYWDKDRNAKLVEFKKTVGSKTWDGVPIAELIKGNQRHRSGLVHGDGLVSGKKKKRMGKKERNKRKALAEESADTGPHPEEDVSNEHHEVDEDADARPKKRRKKNKTVD